MKLENFGESIDGHWLRENELNELYGSNNKKIKKLREKIKELQEIIEYREKLLDIYFDETKSDENTLAGIKLNLHRLKLQQQEKKKELQELLEKTDETILERADDFKGMLDDTEDVFISQREENYNDWKENQEEHVKKIEEKYDENSLEKAKKVNEEFAPLSKKFEKK